MKTYHQISISAEPFNAEILSSLMWAILPSGIEERDNHIIVYTEDDSPDESMITHRLQEAVTNGLISNFSIHSTQIENKNWNAEWEQSINVIKVSDKIVIKPTFREYSQQPDEIVLTLDPKMSFGTGEHQTTKLMIRAIEKFIQSGDRVLDVGTGTGVLAIASVKLGAASALAIDNDEWCLENGIENVNLNNVKGSVSVQTATIDQISETHFTLVLANIQKNVLVEIAQDLCSKIADGGKLILSGLLHEDENDIVEVYSTHSCSLIEKFVLDEWIALVFHK